MNLEILKRLQSVAKSVTGRKTSLSVFLSSFSRALSAASSYNDMAEVYEQLPIVYGSIYTIATEGASLPISLTQKKEKVDKHPLLDLIKRPNSRMSWFDLIEATLTYLEVSGNAFWEKVSNPLGRTTELHPIRPDRIKIIPREDGKGVKEYEFRVRPEGIVKETFTPDQIIHFRYFSPLGDWLGQPTLKAAIETVLLERHAIQWSKAFFERDATPAGILTVSSRVPPKERARLEQSWRSKLEGRAFETIVLTGGMTYQKIGADPRDIQLNTLRKFNREELMEVFGTNNAILGLTENMTYDNYRMQLKSFYRHTLRPKMLKIQGGMNAFLVPEFGDDLLFGFDLSSVLMDLEESAARHGTLVKSGLETLNQAIKDLGGESFPGGDNRYISLGLGLLKEDGTIQSPTPGLPPGRPEGKSEQDRSEQDNDEN